jgi:hypothetical protein
MITLLRYYPDLKSRLVDKSETGGPSKFNCASMVKTNSAGPPSGTSPAVLREDKSVPKELNVTSGTIVAADVPATASTLARCL